MQTADTCISCQEGWVASQSEEVASQSEEVADIHWSHRGWGRRIQDASQSHEGALDKPRGEVRPAVHLRESLGNLQREGGGGTGHV